MEIKQYYEEQYEGQHENPKENCKWGLKKICFTSMNFVNHGLIAFLTVYLVYLASDLWNTTNLHVALCTIGYVLLMAEATVLLAEENLWTNFLSRQTNKHIHWILQIGGAVFSITGVAVMYNKSKRHFHSIHGITGIISVAFIFLVAFLGIFALYAVRLRKIVKPVLFKILHNILGIFCFVIGMTSMLYGLEKRWMKINSTDEMTKTCIIFTYAITLFSLFGALRSLFNQAEGLIR